jgi:hypothetical protein
MKPEIKEMKMKSLIVILSLFVATVAYAETPCGDVNGSGTVTLADAVIIGRALTGDAASQAALTHPENCDVGGVVGCTLEDKDIILGSLVRPTTKVIVQQCLYNDAVH